jgi:hypothetical protein
LSHFGRIDAWKETKKEEAKDRLMFWLFWGFVAAAGGFAWFFFKHPY